MFIKEGGKSVLQMELNDLHIFPSSIQIQPASTSFHVLPFSLLHAHNTLILFNLLE